MNKDRMLTLIDMLENHDEYFPEVKFDINDWVNPCGTAACALGSAALYKPFMDEGLEMYGAEPKYKSMTGYSAGSYFFDISINDSHYMFDPFEYPFDEHITPQMVADRAKEVMERYS